METMNEPTRNMDSMMMNEPKMQKSMEHAMHHRRGIIAAVFVAVGAIGWYLFRPELLFIDQNVNEAFPTATASTGSNAMPSMPLGEARAQGKFHDGAHETKGIAAIYQLAGGERILRLTDFATSNGPDVHVLLGKAADAMDNDTVKSAGYVDLGSLKGNIGDQNYTIPTEVDPAEYNSVTIWCNRFSVNFGTAPLKMN